MNPPLWGRGGGATKGPRLLKLPSGLIRFPHTALKVTLKEMEVISRIEFFIVSLISETRRNLQDFLTRINFSSISALAPTQPRMILINGAL